MTNEQPNTPDVADQPVYAATFYRFAALQHVAELRARLQHQCEQLGLMGTILLANEGINSTICGRHDALLSLFEWLNQYPQLANLKYRLSQSGFMPFKRLKVRVRSEIVSFGQAELDPAAQTGEHVSPDQPNHFLRL